MEDFSIGKECFKSEAALRRRRRRRRRRLCEAVFDQLDLKQENDGFKISCRKEGTESPTT